MYLANQIFIENNEEYEFIEKISKIYCLDNSDIKELVILLNG